jgi:hypothetical protein
MARRSAADLEVRAFTATPAGRGLAVLELRARLLAGREPRFLAPRLLAGDGHGRAEAFAATDVRRESDADEPGWRMTFAAPLEAVGATELTLSLSPGLMFDLPAPDDAEEVDGGFAELAREAGELRRRAEEAERAHEREAERADSEHAARADAEEALAEARARAEQTAARLAAAEEALSIARGDHAKAIEERDRELAALRERELELTRRVESSRPPAGSAAKLASRPAPRPREEETERLVVRGALAERRTASPWQARAFALGALVLALVILLVVLAGAH